MVRGYAAVGDRDESGFPGVGTEEGGCDVGIVQVEEGRGEGLEGWG